MDTLVFMLFKCHQPPPDVPAQFKLKEISRDGSLGQSTACCDEANETDGTVVTIRTLYAINQSQ